MYFQGILTVVEELDRETDSQYTIRVIATDNPARKQESRSKSQDGVIFIQDVNDNHPTFNAPYEATVVETKGVDDLVLTVLADDADDGVNGEVRYYFLNGTNPPGLFSIEEHSGDIRVNKSLIGKVGHHILAVIAEDQGDPKLTGNTTINITVNDVNLNNPVIGHIPENNTIKVYEVRTFDFLF